MNHLRVLMSLVHTAILFYVEPEDLTLARPVIEAIVIYLDFLVGNMDKHMLEYFQDKMDFIEGLIMCGAESEVRSCLVELKSFFQRFILYKEMMSNRLKNSYEGIRDIGVLDNIPFDIRLEIARYI